MSNSNSTYFPEAIRIAIQSQMVNLNVCLPGRIVRIIDNKKMKISVQPEIKRVFLDGDELEPPIIDNVPLHFYGSSKSLFSVPIEVDDKVTLIFSQRSLDNWLTAGKLSTPGHRRFFDMSDAIAIPGIQAFNENHALAGNNDKILLTSNDYDIEIDSKSKKLTLKNTVEDLAKIMDDFLDNLIQLQTIGSPVQHTLSPVSIADLTAIKIRLTNLLKKG